MNRPKPSNSLARRRERVLKDINIQRPRPNNQISSNKNNINKVAITINFQNTGDTHPTI